MHWLHKTWSKRRSHRFCQSTRWAFTWERVGNTLECRRQPLIWQARIRAQLCQIPPSPWLWSWHQLRPWSLVAFTLTVVMGRLNNSTTVTVQDPSHLFTLIAASALNIRTLRLCTDDILEAVFNSVKKNAVKGTKTNIFVAAFTTCHARLKLYESLDTLQKQVLYYDTDSVVEKWRPGQPYIAIGDFLRYDRWTGWRCHHRVCFRWREELWARASKVVCKVRGLTLNVRGSAILNFKTMKDNILSELETPQHSEHSHTLSFSKGLGTETNSSRSARKAVWVGFRQAGGRCRDQIESSLWLREDWGWNRPFVRFVNQFKGVTSPGCHTCPVCKNVLFDIPLNKKYDLDRNTVCFY